MDRRAFLSISAVPLTSSAIWSGTVEPAWFELTHTSVRIPGARKRRILHVSDIHMSDGMRAEDLETSFDAGLAQKPDLICLTGDFVSSPWGFDKKGLDRLLRRARDTAPTFAVLGNHDYSSVRTARGRVTSSATLQDLVRRSGVRLLHNENALVGDLTVVGVADLWQGEFFPEKAFAGVSPAATTLVLCHNPDGKDPLLSWKWDLMLSGHTHGGQVCVPGVPPWWIPVQDKRFVAGLYEWQDRQLFITRGIGSPRHVRAFCRPEVSIVDLV